MQSLFSIIVPIYGVEPYLRKCLKSVVDQNYGDWECICVDDGCLDGCAAILDEELFLIENKRLIAIHQANGGVSVARNTALDLAHGQWLQFLDSDDSLKQDFLKCLSYDISMHPEVDAIEHSAIYCQADGCQMIGSDTGQLPPEGVILGEDILADSFGRKYTNLGRCSCYKIFRRSVIESAGLRFTKGIPLGEDELFATQFYAYAGKIAVCPNTAGYLRISREGSALMTISAAKLLPKIRGLELLYRTWKKRPSKGMAVRLSAVVIMLAFLGANQGRETRSECIEELLKSHAFNKVGIPFVILHGTWKSRLFAFVYKISPTMLRRRMLWRLA